MFIEMSATKLIIRKPIRYARFFDTRLLWGLVLAVFLWVMMGGVAQASGIDGLDVRVSFDSGEAVVRIVVKNVAQRSLEIYESLSSRLVVPYFLSYSLRDTKHGVITKIDQRSDGFLSSNMLRSNLLESPEKRRLIEVPSQGELSRKVNLSDLMQGTKKYWSVKPSDIDAAYIKLKIRIYADRDFSKYVDVESDECEVSGAYLANH